MKSAVLLMVLSCSVAQGHFSLLAPASAVRSDNGGKGGPPCASGTESGIVTDAAGGHALTIRLSEFVPHPGHYRVALSVNSRAELPPDPVVQASGGVSVSAAIQAPVRAPLLADGLFAHTGFPPSEWRTDVVLPNLDCEKCTLQIIEFMAEHGEPFYYHHCADLRIKSDPALPAADATWPRGAGAGRPTAAVLPHTAEGGGWSTSLTLVNLDSVAVPFAVQFRNDGGTEGRLGTVNGTIAANGFQTIDLDASAAGVTTGWATITSPRSIDSLAMFRFGGQEASVPVLSAGGKTLELPLEMGSGLGFGVALANPGDTDVRVTATVRNERGDVLTTLAPVSIGRRQHVSFVVSASQIPAGRALLELTSDGADIYAMGIRANGGAFTSVRALVK